jgi:hypothetical protein
MNWSLGKEVEGKRHVPYKRFDDGWHDYRPADPKYPIYLWTLSMEDEDLERVLRTQYDPQWHEVYIPGLSGRDHTGRETKHYIANTVAWFNFIRGNNPEYPEQMLNASYELIISQMKRMMSDAGDPYQWDLTDFSEAAFSSIHIWQEMCPLYFEALVQLTLGSPMLIKQMK